jgi:hypothetical protein
MNKAIQTTRNQEMKGKDEMSEAGNFRNENKKTPESILSGGLRIINLCPRDICCMRTFGSLFQFELDFITFIQRFISITYDGIIVDKNVLAFISADEAITLGSVKPFDSSCLHRTIPLKKI